MLVSKQHLESEKAKAPVFRPSGLNGLAKCFLFQGEAEDTDAEDSEEAQQGQIEHTAMKLMLNELVKTGTLAKAGKNLDADAYDRCLWGVQHVLTDEQTDSTILAEQRLFLAEGFTKIMYGTADVVILNKDTDTLIVKDYKTGGIVRDCRPQLICYGLAGMWKYHYKKVELEVVYTRMRKTEKYVIDEDGAKGVLSTIFTNYFENDNPEAHLNEYCMFCARNTVCPLMTEIVNAIALKREDWALEGYHHADYLSTEENRGKAITLAKLMNTWSDGAIFHVKSAMMQGNAAEGWKLRQQRGKGSVPNTIGAYLATDLKPDDFMSICNISVTRIADYIWESAEGQLAYKSKAACKRAVVKKLEERDLIERGDDVYVLTREK